MYYRLALLYLLSCSWGSFGADVCRKADFDFLKVCSDSQVMYHEDMSTPGNLDFSTFSTHLSHRHFLQ